MSIEEEYSLLERVHSQINSFNTYPKIVELIDIVKKHAIVSSENNLKKELYQSIYKINSSTQKDDRNIGICDLIKEDLIQTNVLANDWQSALYLSALPLLQNNYINRNYIEKIIANVNVKYASYLITKSTALAHAKPEDGVNKLSLSITVLKKPILIKNDREPTKYIFTLAAVDKTSHIQAMSELVSLLEMPSFYEILNNANKPEQIFSFILNLRKAK